MPAIARVFYIFSATHSFLLGLIALFIPVILWKSGASLSSISFFIALSSVSFAVALIYWDKFRANLAWSRIFALSFLFEALLAYIVIFTDKSLILTLGALISGITGCFYWSTQRVLFLKATDSSNTGNTFGNFQILVAFSLKIGILVGSYLLETSDLKTLFIVALITSAVGNYLTNKIFKRSTLINQAPVFTFNQIRNFKDEFHSRSIFLVDGLFLFFESYFWVISLYIMIGGSIAKLGMVIVVLSVVLAISFIFIKKRIDRINSQRIFLIAVVGYILSWLLRSNLSIDDDPYLFYLTLLVITFLSNFFRLAFNKRFYNIARQGNSTHYILCKSYFSQLSIIVFFTIIGILMALGNDPMRQLQILYLIIIPLSCVYFLYKDPKRSKQSQS